MIRVDCEGPEISRHSMEVIPYAMSPNRLSRNCPSYLAESFLGWTIRSTRIAPLYPRRITHRLSSIRRRLVLLHDGMVSRKRIKVELRAQKGIVGSTSAEPSEDVPNCIVGALVSPEAKRLPPSGEFTASSRRRSLVPGAPSFTGSARRSCPCPYSVCARPRSPLPIIRVPVLPSMPVVPQMGLS